MRVLVAEDDPSVSAALTAALTRAGHQCTTVSRGSSVLSRYREVDVIFLDLGLEDMDGIEVLRQLRTVSDIPVMVITARGDERTTVQALRLGADDYLIKPVRLHELLARLLAVTRRTVLSNADHITVGNVTIDLAAHCVIHAGTEISLTPTEFDLLTALAQQPGLVLSRQSVLDKVWGDGYSATSRSFDVHLAQLRQKLPMLTITTIRGVGLRLEAPL